MNHLRLQQNRTLLANKTVIGIDPAKASPITASALDPASLALRLLAVADSQVKAGDEGVF